MAIYSVIYQFLLKRNERNEKVHTQQILDLDIRFLNIVYRILSRAQSVPFLSTSPSSFLLLTFNIGDLVGARRRNFINLEIILEIFIM